MLSFPDPEQLENEALHALVDFRGARVLEIGCGDGRLMRHYVRETAWAIGLDPDDTELLASRSEYLKNIPANVRLTQGRAETLPFASSSFDVVIFGWSL